MTAVADRHLLFGLIALQVGLIDQGQLVAAFQAWTRDKSRPLTAHLVARGDLDDEQRAGVEAMVALHLKKHGDVDRSLAILPASKATREGLARLGDPDVEATLGHVGSGLGLTECDGRVDAEQTTDHSVGSATSDGQRFRVLRPHARGGLGVVSVALDRELHREVALKQILEKHADDPTSRARFLLEAEVTGGLEHPGIVPVYGLGTQADGRPFYAMRLIRGDTLKEATDRFHADETSKGDPGRRSLELRKLLRRFMDVCNAMDYAHSRGVLHRDIKPGNIIVGKHGETLVVDWGLAKATGKSEPGAGERTLRPSGSGGGSSETLPGSALGTPAYMSPEQGRGELEALGPRSDVYSLGATLYCLLTGKPPFEGDDLGEILRKVQKGDFARPRDINSSLDEALEAICLKAMATAPEGRYPSCRSLAEDLERWMADEPVTAWHEPWTRGLARWLGRHRSGVTGAAAAVLAGVVGLSAVLAVQATANARLSQSLKRETAANAALATANDDLKASKAAVQARYDLAVDAIKTFHTGVSGDFLLKEDQFKTLRDRLLKSASDFYGRLGALLGKETDLASRRALARSNFELARLTEQVGRREDALAAHRAVLAAREALASEPGANVEAKADVGRSLTRVASTLYALGKGDEALAMYRQAETLLAGLNGPAALAALANCRVELAVQLRYAGRLDEALAACRLARADQEVLALQPGAGVEARRELAETIQMIGYLFWIMGKPGESLAEFRTVMPIFERLAAENPAEFEFRRNVGRTHFYLGNVLPLLGRTTEGEVEFRKGIEIHLELAREHPAITSLRRYIGLSRHYLGNLLAWAGKPAEGEAEIRAAIDLFRKLVEDDPDVPDHRDLLVDSHRSLGLVFLEGGRAMEGEAEFRRACEAAKALAGRNADIPRFGECLILSLLSLGDAVRSLGRPAEARDDCERAIALIEGLDRAGTPNLYYRSLLARSTRCRGLARRDLGDLAGAADDTRQASRSFDGIAYQSGPDLVERACCHATLAGLAGRSGSGVSAAEGEVAASRAMEFLGRAFVMGYRHANYLRTEPAVDSLRSRDDFQLLMRDMAFPANPFTPGG